MVNPSAITLGTALILAMASAIGLGASPPADPDPTGEVARALAKASFPWYDARTDGVKPVALPAEPTPASPSSGSSSSGSSDLSWFRWAGNLVSLVGFGLVLASLIGLMLWFWRIYAPTDSEDRIGPARAQGVASRVEALPEGMRAGFESLDPWEEAIRRRDRGDLAGAVVCLFAHQLLTLSRLGVIRLAPGRTARQLLRSVADVDLRALVLPTLRLFEVAYYGHRAPTPDEFAALWSQAEAFERRVAVGVAT